MKSIGLIFSILFCLGCQGSGAVQAPAPGDWSGLVKLEGVDFMGGDIRRLKETASAKACAEACAAESKCFAFTYAKPTHKKASKQRSCWLKKSGFRYGRNLQYTSGIKVN